MRRLVLIVVCLAALVTPSRSHAQPPPPALTGAVNDFAGVIDRDNAQALTDLSARLTEATGDVLVVATVKTYQPWPDIQSYAVKMFENAGRGIGHRTEGKSDNGVLMLLAVEDRRVRIEVGYGLEPFITDGFAGQVSRDAMVPFFKQGDYGGGLRAGAEQVAARLAGARGKTLPGLTTSTPPRQRSGGGFPWWLILLLLYLIFITRFRRGRRNWGGPWSGWSSGAGGFGAGFGGGFGRRILRWRVRRRVRRLRRRPERRGWRRRVMVDTHVGQDFSPVLQRYRKEDRCAGN